MTPIRVTLPGPLRNYYGALAAQLGYPDLPALVRAALADFARNAEARKKRRATARAAARRPKESAPLATAVSRVHPQAIGNRRARQGARV